MKMKAVSEQTNLEKEYHEIIPKAERLMKELKHQMEHIVASKNVVLGVPIESRIKTWASLYSKIERNALDIGTISAVTDLIGIRIILLFKRDVDVVCELIGTTFKIVSKEDKNEILGIDQFGYASVHYQISQPNEWSSVPSFAELSGLQVEVQVRTLAQHIWAAASHFLQYKNEKSVPHTVLRSINRVAALLETADLEFDRALDLRAKYMDQMEKSQPDSDLNVDLLRGILDAFWPPQNKVDSEDYSQLLNELVATGVFTRNKLRELLERHQSEVMQKEQEAISYYRNNPRFPEEAKERLKKGIYFSHVGLTRKMLEQELGQEYWDLIKAPRRKPRTRR